MDSRLRGNDQAKRSGRKTNRPPAPHPAATDEPADTA